MIDIADVNVKAAYDKAILSAINKTLDQTKTFVKRELASRYNMRPSDVDKYLSVVRANAQRPKGWIACYSAWISLSKFAGTTQTATGAQATIGKTFVIPHSFIVIMKSGHSGVYVRVGEPVPVKQGRYAGKVYTRREDRLGQPILRQKLIEKTGPNIARLFGSQEMTEKMQAFAADTLPRLFNHDFLFYLFRRG